MFEHSIFFCVVFIQFAPLLEKTNNKLTNKNLWCENRSTLFIPGMEKFFVIAARLKYGSKMCMKNAN